MGAVNVRAWSKQAWDLERRQHGVVTRRQLLELGMSPAAIRWRLANGRLHRAMPGVYSVGRRQLSERGRWTAGVLACGRGALLSHRSAAALWGIRNARRGEPVEVTVPAGSRPRRPQLRVHRRRGEPPGAAGPAAAAYRRHEVAGIPVSSPILVLVDLASLLPSWEVEAAINEADHLSLVRPELLRRSLDHLPPRPGLSRLRDLMDEAEMAIAATALERMFRPIARRAGLPAPQTQAELGRSRVDFYWPELNLVVEADSLKYHRTPFKQRRDLRRDHAHRRAGRESIHFSHGQIRHEPDYVQGELEALVGDLTERRGRKLSS